MAQQIDVTLGAPPDSFDDVTRLYVEAFAEKLTPFLGTPERAARFLASGLAPERVFVARRDGEIAGVAGFKENGRGLFELGLRVLFAEYGWSAPFRALGLMLLERREVPDCLLMDGIVVAAEMRGNGVGTLLLQAIEKHARALGKQKIRLDVIDTNPGARRLYERFGFSPVRTVGTGLLAPLFSFRSATEMHKVLS